VLTKQVISPTIKKTSSTLTSRDLQGVCDFKEAHSYYPHHQIDF